MKTVNDFKVENGVAILEGVAYAEEAKVVDEYLRNNSNIEFASIRSKDNRKFVLKDSRLVSTQVDTFPNPYYASQETKPIVNTTENTIIQTKIKELEIRLQAIEKAFLSVSKSITN